MLHLKPVPSRLRWLLILILHALAAAALIHSGAPLWLKAGLAPLVLLSLWLEAVIFLGRRDVVELRLSAAAVDLRIDGEAVTAEPPRVRHCSEWLIILEFAVRSADSGRRRFTLVLFSDSLQTAQLRRLRRWLNYEAD